MAKHKKSIKIPNNKRKLLILKTKVELLEKLYLSPMVGNVGGYEMVNAISEEFKKILKFK